MNTNQHKPHCRSDQRLFGRSENADRRSVFEKTLQSTLQLGLIGNATLPDDQHVPIKFLESPDIAAVSNDCARELFFPQRDVLLGHRTSRTPTMPMPKTAVYKYDLPSARKHNVGLPRQVCPMEPVSIPHLSQQTANDLFGICFSGTNTAHPFASAFVGHVICTGHSNLIVPSAAWAFELSRLDRRSCTKNSQVVRFRHAIAFPLWTTRRIRRTLRVDDGMEHIEQRFLRR